MIKYDRKHNYRYEELKRDLGCISNREIMSLAEDYKKYTIALPNTNTFYIKSNYKEHVAAGKFYTKKIAIYGGYDIETLCEPPALREYKYFVKEKDGTTKQLHDISSYYESESNYRNNVRKSMSDKTKSKWYQNTIWFTEDDETCLFTVKYVSKAYLITKIS